MYKLKVFKYKERPWLGFLTMFLSFLIPFCLWIIFDKYKLDFVILGIIWIVVLFSLPILMARFRFIDIGTLYFDSTKIEIIGSGKNISFSYQKIGQIEFYYQTDHYWLKSIGLFSGYFRYHGIRKNYKGSKENFERLVIDGLEYYLKIRNKKEFEYMLKLKNVIMEKTNNNRIYSKSFDNEEFVLVDSDSPTGASL